MTLQFQDWLNNGQQATGYFAEQYRLSVANARELAKWASENHVSLSFTGHSLGGGLANANALATGLHATIFNPAGLHDNTINDPLLKLNLSHANMVDYYVNQGEIVDIANGIMGTPARGTRHDIGRDPLVTASIWYASTWAGIAYSGYLHTMGSLLDVFDCD